MLRPFTVFLLLTSFASADTSLIKGNQNLFGRDVFFLGETARDGVLTLDANNGFFDKGSFAASGKHEAPSDDERELIHFHYRYLISKEDKSTGTAHWYAWLPKAGQVNVSVSLKVQASDQGIPWQVAIDDQDQTVIAQTSEASMAQPWKLQFQIREPGRHRISIRKLGTRRAMKTEIHGIELSGPGIAGSHLLRARWRPSAIHTQYSSSTCPTVRMWVMESQSLSDFGSYSPITTPFGYFGGSFNEYRVASGNMNFSMWAANSKATKAPPVHKMPHLLATGHPDAVFGGFGHEGSGVKIRNWDPLSHQPRSIIQALRMETDDGFDTYSGYLFDARTNEWILYAVGRKPHHENRNRKDSHSLKISSFCEIPGPADRERTGDRPRSIRRRGWVADEQGNWHSLDRQTSRNRRQTGPINKHIAVDKEGWFVMSTGGMEMLSAGPSEVRAKTSRQLPKYLQPNIASQLFEYPATIGRHEVSKITRTSAEVTWQIPNAGQNPIVKLYYGPLDCLSFAPRNERHATESKGVIGEVFAEDRTWPHVATSTVANQSTTFRLANLAPKSTYHFRVFLKNDVGQLWSFDSGQFSTRE